MNGETHFKIEPLRIENLIVAITDAALQVTEDEEMANRIAGIALMNLLAASAPETADYLLAASGGVTIH
jgi:hypothetical protein